jgi:hypothetical protein
VPRRLSQPLVPAVLALITVISISCTQGDGPGTAPTYHPGPLQGTEPWGTITLTGVPARVDQPISIGVTVVSHDMPAELRVVGALASTGRGESFVCVGSSRSFPPAGCRGDPLEGWRISGEAVEHGGFQIVLGLAASRPGTYGYPGVLLTYTDTTGERFTDVFLQGGQVCAPMKDGQAGCPRSGEIRRDQREVAEDLEAGTFVMPTAA